MPPSGSEIHNAIHSEGRTLLIFNPFHAKFIHMLTTPADPFWLLVDNAVKVANGNDLVKEIFLSAVLKNTRWRKSKISRLPFANVYSMPMIIE